MWQPWRLCLDLTCRRRSPFICEECNELSLSSCNTRGSATVFETTLFPGSSQPLTDHCRGTGPGLCWSIALWAICVLACIVGRGETAQSCIAAWSFLPISLPPPASSFLGARPTLNLKVFLATPAPSALYFSQVLPATDPWHLYLCYDICFLENINNSCY